MGYTRKVTPSFSTGRLHGMADCDGGERHGVSSAAVREPRLMERRRAHLRRHQRQRDQLHAPTMAVHTAERQAPVR